MNNESNTTTDEIADGIYRISTYVAAGPPGGITYNQFLIDGDEPMLFHTGTRSLFPQVRDATRCLVDIGGHRLRWLDTPHVPGPWESGVLFDETTSTLFCGDLFSRTGPAVAVTTDDVSSAAIAHDQLMHGHAYTPQTGPTLRRLAAFAPQRLALMHGPAFEGDGAGKLLALADYFDACLKAA